MTQSPERSSGMRFVTRLILATAVLVLTYAGGLIGWRVAYYGGHILALAVAPAAAVLLTRAVRKDARQASVMAITLASWAGLVAWYNLSSYLYGVLFQAMMPPGGYPPGPEGLLVHPLVQTIHQWNLRLHFSGCCWGALAGSYWRRRGSAAE